MTEKKKVCYIDDIKQHNRYKEIQMDFTNYNHVEVLAYIFADEKGKKLVEKIVDERMRKEEEEENNSECGVV